MPREGPGRLAERPVRGSGLWNLRPWPNPDERNPPVQPCAGLDLSRQEPRAPAFGRGLQDRVMGVTNRSNNNV